MARNPLDDGDSATYAGQSRAMQIGETKTWTARDAKTGETGKTYVLERTARPYAYDLADAYNAKLSREEADRGLLWTVDSNGSLRLGIAEQFTHSMTKRLKAQAERDRLTFKHRMEYPINREAAE